MNAPPTVLAGALTLLCADLDARPLFWTEDDGRRDGYEPAIAAALAARLGLELRWRFVRWADFRPALERGAADAIWCGQAITPARREQVLFGRPYARFDEAVVMRAGETVAAGAELRGRRLGAIVASTNMALAESFGAVETVAFDGTSDDVLAEMLDALRDGAVDAVVDDEPAFLDLDDPALRVAFTCPTHNLWAAALRRGEDELCAALDAALAAIDLALPWRRWLPALPFPAELAGRA